MIPAYDKDQPRSFSLSHQTGPRVVGFIAVLVVVVVVIQDLTIILHHALVNLLDPVVNTEHNTNTDTNP